MSFVKNDRSLKLGIMPRITDERRTERRQQILTAARDQFAANGFHATSMDDIVRAAGMSPGGVYRHFAGKEEIISAIAREAIGQLAETIDASLAERPVPTVGEAMRRLIGQIDAMADGPGRLALVVWSEAQRDPAIAAIAAAGGRQIRDRLIRLFELARDRGEVGAGADPVALAQAGLGLMIGYLVQRRVFGGITAGSYAEGVRAMTGAAAGWPSAAADADPAGE